MTIMIRSQLTLSIARLKLGAIQENYNDNLIAVIIDEQLRHSAAQRLEAILIHLDGRKKREQGSRKWEGEQEQQDSSRPGQIPKHKFG